MAKTFDNISDASATNYLFLFAQRTLALQNEPPTPPPFNVLGLPCRAVCLLWKWVQKHQQKQKVKSAEAVLLLNAIADFVRRAAVTCGEDDGGGGGEGESGGTEHEGEGKGEGEGSEGEGGGGEGKGEGEGEGERGEGKGEQDGEPSEGKGRGGEGEGEQGDIEAATQKKAIDERHSSTMVDGQGEEKEKTLAQKITPLAEKITEYINSHQDDAAQEDRWRTIMKRETMKRFREQREAIDTHGKVIAAEVRQASDKQGEAIAEVRKAVDTQRQQVQKIEAGVQKVETEMQALQLRVDEKMDELITLVKNELVTCTLVAGWRAEGAGSAVGLRRRRTTHDGLA